MKRKIWSFAKQLQESQQSTGGIIFQSYIVLPK